MWMGRLGEMEGYLEGGAPEFLLQQKQTSGQSQIEDRAAGSWRNLHGGWEKSSEGSKMGDEGIEGKLLA